MAEPEEVPTHCERDDRYREPEAHPETPRHVDQFWIGTRFGAPKKWLQGHTADRAVAGPDLVYLRVHGARVDRALGYRSGVRLRGREILVRLRHEFGPAASRAEVVRLSREFVFMFRLVRVAFHAADRIGSGMRRIG